MASENVILGALSGLEGKSKPTRIVCSFRNDWFHQTLFIHWDRNLLSIWNLKLSVLIANWLNTPFVICGVILKRSILWYLLQGNDAQWQQVSCCWDNTNIYSKQFLHRKWYWKDKEEEQLVFICLVVKKIQTQLTALLKHDQVISSWAFLVEVDN